MQGFFIIWNASKKHFTFRLTGQILPQGSIIVAFVDYKTEEKFFFSTTAEVPPCESEPWTVVCVDVGEDKIEWMTLLTYMDVVIMEGLYLVNGTLSTSFAFHAVVPSDTAVEEIPSAPWRNTANSDLNVSEDGELVWE